ncbi:hypothetical protein BKK80_34725 (plasmid) [Cupriavidus malaysiensis]|uniref:DUF4376 domain-containing protein n=2 Tax=Cupriavidus malaysiensis TaxID=367825 RepID=A0ABM6FGM9_9BURK|nr:hypothetical protein BKK80_34725 [Cupriavidus malaysiensis]
MTDDGGWPTVYFDDDDDEELEFDPAELICPYLEDGQVLVLLEVGAERLRYLTGRAEAYASDGRRTVIGLSNIYQAAADAFGIPINEIGAAEE